MLFALFTLGISKWPKEKGCKLFASSFVGSTPSPITGIGRHLSESAIRRQPDNSKKEQKAVKNYIADLDKRNENEEWRKRVAKKITSIDAPWGDFWGEFYGDHKVINAQIGLDAALKRQKIREEEAARVIIRNKRRKRLKLTLGVSIILGTISYICYRMFF